MSDAWVTSLLGWYRKEKREMPWRENSTPYRVWISEMMLQQTQVATVIPYFNRFMECFPTVYDLAKADQQDVLKAWEGLGYYSRARNLHKASKTIVNELNGSLPTTYESLQTLSGIGPYCAAAIASISFKVPVPVVDGNVIRVFTRFWGIFDDVRQTKVRNVLFERLTSFIKQVCPSDFNQAMMECGALICKPQQPLCQQCPLSDQCFAFEFSKQQELPYKSKALPVPHYNIGVGVIFDGDRVLIAKRKEDQMLGGLWEFPGGKQVSKESIQETVKREIKEETSLDIVVNDLICKVNHAYSHFKITLHAYHCNYVSGKAVAKESDEVKWVSTDQLSEYPFPKANKKVLSYLQD